MIREELAETHDVSNVGGVFCDTVEKANIGGLAGATAISGSYGEGEKPTGTSEKEPITEVQYGTKQSLAKLLRTKPQEVAFGSGMWQNFGPRETLLSAAASS